MTTLANAIRDAAARLPGEEARLEAELLLAHALQRPRSWFYAHAGDVLAAAEAQAFGCVPASGPSALQREQLSELEHRINSAAPGLKQHTGG